MLLIGYHRKLLFVISLILALNLYSQSPSGINYQTKLRGNNGIILSNNPVDLQFEVINTATNLSVYKEAHNAITDNFGLVDLVIGNGSVISGSFGNIPWNNGSLDLLVYMDTSGFGNYKLMGQSKLYSVPYALYSQNAGPDDDWFRNSGKRIYTMKDSVGIGTMTPSEKLQVYGNIKTEGFIMVPGAQLGYVLTTDNNGNSSWQPPTGLQGPQGPTGPGGGPAGPLPPAAPGGGRPLVAACPPGRDRPHPG